MICSLRQYEYAKTRRWTICLSALLLVLASAHASVAKESRARQLRNEPRLAQSPPASPWETIKALSGAYTGAEALPTPPPTAPPTQHVIPFAKPDPDAKILFKEKDGLISLTVHGGSLRHTIAMIAEAQGLNIVFSAPADIGITASLEGVPWQKALDSLLTASGYTWANNEGIIFVISLETANYMAPDAGGRQTRIFELDFASAVDVDQAIKGMLSPGGDSWILESSATDNRRSRETIIASDYPVQLRRIEDYIFQVDQPPRQVLIEAHILQVELKDDCRNGVNFEAIASFHGNEISLRTVGFANPAATSAFFLETTGHALTNLVELLKTTTDAKTLASPKLLVVSGQEAHIQVGEQLGYRVTTTTQTSSLETVEFLDVGVVLTVEPRITRDGRVLMRIKPKVSTGQIDPETDLPSEETTEVETDVFLSDGQGMVIGGLIQEQDSIIQSKVPWAGDLPYVGVLFQKRRAIKSRTEIIVTLVPHIQPYSPVVACRESTELMRTQDRLTEGPLNRNPRPYEPRLYDAITNPRPIRVHGRRYHVPAQANHPELRPLQQTENLPLLSPAMHIPGKAKLTIPPSMQPVNPPNMQPVEVSDKAVNLSPSKKRPFHFTR